MTSFIPVSSGSSEVYMTPIQSPISSAYATPAPSPTNQKLTAAAVRVFEQQTSIYNKKLESKWDRYNPIMIGGDFFTFANLGFSGVKAILPSIASISAVSIASLVCGEIAGAINIGVGLISLKEAVQAFKNGNRALGVRMTFDFLFLVAIGVTMILISTALKVAALGAIGAFFAANPWVLPLLFFVISIPLIVELGRKESQILSHTDLGSQFQLDALKEQVNNNHFDLPTPFQDVKESSEQKFIDKMGQLQAEIGIEAALAAYYLWVSLLQEKKEDALDAIATLKKRIEEWNFSKHISMAQQILYTLGFVLSMGALKFHRSASVLTAADNFAMCGANAIPLYMDLFWPFRRNTPVVVPLVETTQLG